MDPSRIELALRWKRDEESEFEKQIREFVDYERDDFVKTLVLCEDCDLLEDIFLTMQYCPDFYPIEELKGVVRTRIKPFNDATIAGVRYLSCCADEADFELIKDIATGEYELRCLALDGLVPYADTRYREVMDILVPAMLKDDGMDSFHAIQALFKIESAEARRLVLEFKEKTTRPDQAKLIDTLLQIAAESADEEDLGF